MRHKTQYKRFGLNRTARCFNENEDFIPLRTAHGKGFLRREYDSEELREALDNPDSLFDKARIFKDSGTTKAGMAEFKIPGAGDIFVKRFNNRGLGYTLKYIFREPRPFRVWRAAYCLEQAGIPTPKPIAALAEFSGRVFPRNAYLIRNAVPGIVPTLEFFRIILKDKDLRREFIESSCGLFAKMHDAGILHGDAKCSNIYVSRKGDSFSYGIWDLLSCRLETDPINTTLRTKEIARFATSFSEITDRLGEPFPDDAEKERFFEIYYKKRNPQ